MKDYSFGNHICALRVRAGLSQFQLGNLVGVSDKAVSKWENSDAKPRIGTCYRLAEVLGVSINELLSCNTTLPARKELNTMKTELWNEVHRRLSIYGETPPILCWSRLAEEKAALEESDAIMSLAVLEKIATAAEKNNTLIAEAGQISSSFAAWLMGATKINPLPPHYRCPQCGKTEFVSDVKDGFDLPPKNCTCGMEMVRDGHDLPYDGYAKAVHGKIGVEIRVSSTFIPVAADIIKTFYKGKATIIPVRFRDTENDRAAYSEKYVVISDREDIPPISKDGFWYADSAEFWYWWKDEVVYTLISSKQIELIEKLCEKTGAELPALLENVTPEMSESLYQKRCCDSAHIASSTKPLCENLAHSFELILKLDGFTRGTGVWCDRWMHNGIEMCCSNGERLVKEARANLLQIPAFREDVWNDVSAALSNCGIRYNGLATEVMEATRKGQYQRRGMSERLEDMLLTIKLPEWYTEYLKNVMYLFPKGHCLAMLLIDIVLEWYRNNYPEVYQQVIAETI